MTSLSVLMVAAMGFPAAQGSQVYVAGMARALVRAGVRVRLATYGHGAPEADWPAGVERLPVLSLPGGTVASGPRVSKLWMDPALTVALVRALRTDPPDVVHCHHVEAPLLARAAMRAAGVRRPLVVNPHTALADELPDWLPGLPAPWVERVGERLDRVAAQGADAGVALSGRGMAALRTWGVRRVLEVPPGVDPAQLDGANAARAMSRWSLGQRPWVVYAGTVDAFQEVDRLVEAVARTRTCGLLVVSGGDLGPLSARAASLGLAPERIRWVRSDSFHDARDAVAAAAVCAIPRRRCAGFPMKLLNHLVLGRVTLMCRGVAPAIEGVIPVPPGDVGAMAGALQAAVDDPEATRALGEAGRRAVLARYGWDVGAARLRALYEELG